MRRTAQFLLDLLYPNRCGCCNACIPWNALLCDACAAVLRPVTVCERCGKAPCCCQEDLPYAGTAVCYAYADTARAGILCLKQGENRNFGVHAGQLLAAGLRGRAAFTCVVPVPMSRRQQRERGYNQAAVIARAVGGALQLPVREDCLRRRYSAVAQHTLDAKARTAHTTIYEATGVRLDGACVILCDDVLTTGSTMRRCAMLLQEAGAETIYIAAAAATMQQTAGRKEDEEWILA